MTIKVAHLYPDLMNLYGESGNIKVLVHHLKRQGITVEVKELSIDDKIDFNKYDLFYIGCGTESNRLLVLNHLQKAKKIIKEALETKFFLVTGNAVSLFGDYIIDENNKEIKALGLFSIHEQYQEERDVREVHIGIKQFDEDIYGFINKQGIVYKDNNEELKSNLIFHNNFYGSYILGPILARNPKLTELLLKNLITSKNNKFKFKPFDFQTDENAYYEFIDFKATKK